MNWNKYPFFRLLAALTLGILISRWLAVGRSRIVLVFGILVALLLLTMVLHRWMRNYRYRWVMGVTLFIAFVMVGVLRGMQCDPTMCRNYFNKVLGESPQGCYLARVVEPPVEKEKTVKVLLELRGFRSDTATVQVSGRLLAYLQKTDAALRLGYGDVLGFAAAVEEVPGPKNPEEFDYRSYLERLGVTGRVYLKDGTWWALGLNEGNPLLSFVGRFRVRLLDALRRNGVTEEEFGVAAAILLGYDESLPPQLRQRYVAAGAMHILCVSGMHVGLLYLIASYVLGFIGRGKRAARLKKWILLFLIGFYALLTGLSPSILRSALMISMMIVGELLHRKGVTLNSVAASAFLILLVNPNDLFGIGFQLSYAAVVGIVVLQRPIYLLFYVKSRLLDKVWEITSVALSAQLATLPFTVFYFHQFTPYFWLSNLFMTPLSFLVILTGMVLLLVAWVPGLGMVMGRLVWASLRVMNLSVSWIEGLPGSLVKGLFMNRLEFALSLLMLLLFFLLVTFRRKRMMLELLTVAVVFTVALAACSQRNAQQRRMVFYSLKNHTAIDLIQGTSHLLLCDEALLRDPSTIDYSLKGAWASMQLDMNPPCYTLDEDVDTWIGVKRRHLLSFQGSLFAFWNPDLPASTHNSPVEVDMLMVLGRQKPALRKALSWYRPALLLIDGSVPSSLAQQWKAQAESMQIKCYCLAEGCCIWEGFDSFGLYGNCF
jgi:competence protein ComEC